jgi:hypothetical protein
MASKFKFHAVENVPGAYLLLDLDERPLYVGSSKNVRNRLVQHFIRQDSSAAADGVLDPYEVLRVVVWYADGMLTNALEAALYHRFRPRWNRAIPPSPTPLPTLTLDNADVVVEVQDTPEQLALRREPLERIEAKLFHLLRAVRKAKIAGASDGTYNALALHSGELHTLFQDTLSRPRIGTESQDPAR